MKRLLASLTILTLAGCGGDNDTSITTQQNQTIDSAPVVPSENTECSAVTANILPVSDVQVLDGDTVDVITEDGDSERVRLLGIDAPESEQAYGDISTFNLIQCVKDMPVTIEWTERDSLNRLLGKVIANRVDCNLNQIQEGAAWHYAADIDKQTEFDQVDYANAASYARINKMGLWFNDNPIRPEDFSAGLTSSSVSFNDERLPQTGLPPCSRTPNNTRPVVPTIPKNNNSNRPNNPAPNPNSSTNPNNNSDNGLGGNLGNGSTIPNDNDLPSGSIIPDGPLTANPGDSLTANPGDSLTANPGDSLTANPGDSLTSNPGDSLTANPGDTLTAKPVNNVNSNTLTPVSLPAI